MWTSFRHWDELNVMSAFLDVTYSFTLIVKCSVMSDCTKTLLWYFKLIFCLDIIASRLTLSVSYGNSSCLSPLKPGTGSQRRCCLRESRLTRCSQPQTSTKHREPQTRWQDWKHSLLSCWRLGVMLRKQRKAWRTKPLLPCFSFFLLWL